MIRTNKKTVIGVALTTLAFIITVNILTVNIVTFKYENEIEDFRNAIDTLQINVDSLTTATDSLQQEVDKYKRAKLSAITGISIPPSFTTSHINFLEQQCSKYGIPLRIAARLIYVESSYNMNAVSHVGARGYMQIMPRTYNHFSKKLGIKYSNEYSNIKVGIYYLRHLYNIFDGYSETNRWKLTLASYNRGPTRIIKNPKKYIQIASNDSYVKKILNI